MGSNRVLVSMILALFTVGTVLAGCSSSSKQQNPDGSKKPYDGVTIVVSGPAGQIEWIEPYARQWEEQSGGQVKINAIPFGEVDDKVLSATATGTYMADIYCIGAALAGDLMSKSALRELPAGFQEKVGWSDVMPVLKNHQLSWAGKAYGIPWDGDILNMFYRKDLLEHAENKEKFKAKFGYELGVPQTWQQYKDVAEFFSGWDWDGDGKPNYGFVELPQRKNHAWNGFLARAAAYAKHPDDPGFFFDPETMEPRINNPGFVQALQDWIDIMPYGPSDMMNYGWAENAQTFVGGKAALDIQWGDIGPMSLDTKQSVVKGKVGYALNPGSNKVWNPKTKKWDEFKEPNRSPFLGFGGWIFVVPKISKNPEAAFDFASLIGSSEVRRKASVSGGSGVNPNSLAQLDDFQLWVGAGFSEAEAKEYTKAIKDSFLHPNAVMDLRIPGAPQYKDALELAISQALSKQASPQKALDEAAASWKQITDRMGRDKQLKAYRESLGLN